MTQANAHAAPPSAPGALSRAGVLALVAALVLAVALNAGPRSGAILAIGWASAWRSRGSASALPGRGGA